MSYAQLIGSTSLPNALIPSPLETSRFGLRVGRLHLGRCDGIQAEQIVALVQGSDLDVVVLRYPAKAVTWFATLTTAGYEVIHADTLVYYRRSLTPPPPPLDALTMRPASDADLGLVEGLVTDMFDGYGNHYLSNPLFRREQVLVGYVEWATSYVAKGAGYAGVLLECSSDRSVVGLATVENGPPGEIALAGLRSAHRGQGLYPVLLRAAGLHLAAEGCSEMVISTQIHNVPAIRAWSSNAFRFDSAFQTVHLVRPGLLR